MVYFGYIGGNLSSLGLLIGLLLYVIGFIIYIVNKNQNKEKFKIKINSLIKILKDEYLFKTSLNKDEIEIIKTYFNDNNYYHKIEIITKFGIFGTFKQTILTTENLLYLRSYLENIDSYTIDKNLFKK